MAAGFFAAMTAASGAAWADGADPEDEILFYRATDGAFRYYDIRSNGVLSTTLQGGTGYSLGWDSITALDLDGGGQDEIFFYRSSDGAFRYYDMRPNGSLSKLLQGGTGYSKGWDSITAVDLNGDGRDEMFFYRSTDGAYRFYSMKSNGALGQLLLGGTGYSLGWDSITAVDITGDGRDEMFFYRSTDGAFRYYSLRPDGSLRSLIKSGTTYSKGWSIITAIDLDEDSADELLFYRNDGTYRFYNVTAAGNLSTPILSGTGYSSSWTTIAAINLQGDLPVERVARFTTFFDCCQPRVTNIRTIARAINGAVVMPGETFSVDAYVGPRTTSKGYVPAPYLVNGQGQCCAVGGGVSQFGTTIHNAVFWGGYDLVDSAPHTGWISRYPLGIEATLVYGSIDYKFRNDTVTPVTIRTSSTGTSVTVELWGNQGGWQMSGFHPIGARSSRISVIDRGGADAKRVSASVTGSAPGVVRIERRRTGEPNDVRFWRYVS
jgi:hypothetical protein